MHHEEHQPVVKPKVIGLSPNAVHSNQDDSKGDTDEQEGIGHISLLKNRKHKFAGGITVYDKSSKPVWVVLHSDPNGLQTVKTGVGISGGISGNLKLNVDREKSTKRNTTHQVVGISTGSNSCLKMSDEEGYLNILYQSSQGEAMRVCKKLQVVREKTFVIYHRQIVGNAFRTY